MVNLLAQEFLVLLQERVKSKKIYENNLFSPGGSLDDCKIKKGDNVIVLSGKDKGKNGKVLKIIKSKVDTRVKAIVEGVNVVKKHTKQWSNF